jgi:hypothetical protein
MTDDEVDLEVQWLKRELEKTYPRARALIRLLALLKLGNMLPGEAKC